jgi:hypothetical protein
MYADVRVGEPSLRREFRSGVARQERDILERAGTVTLIEHKIDTRPEPQPMGRCPVSFCPSTESRGEDPTCHDERVSDDLVSVLWTSSLVEAEIAKGRLEAESIPVQLVGEGADDPFPVGPAELLVPTRLEEEARRILAQSEDGADRS